MRKLYYFLFCFLTSTMVFKNSFSQKKAIITGRITGKTIPKYIQINVENRYIPDNDKMYSAKVVKNGSFKSEIDIPYFTSVSVGVDSSSCDLYLNSGDSIYLELSSQDYRWPIDMRGTSAAFNKTISQYFKNERVSNKQFAVSYDYDNPASFKKMEYARRDYRLSNLRTYKKNNKLSTEEQEFIKNTIDYNWGVNLLSYGLNQDIIPGQEFYNFLDVLKIENKNAAKTSMYYWFLNIYSNYVAKKVQLYRSQDLLSIKDGVDLILSEDSGSTVSQKAILQKYSAADAGKFNRQDTLFLDSVFKKHEDIFFTHAYKTNPFVLNLFSLPRSFSRDVLLTYEFANLLTSNFREPVELFLNKYNNEITDTLVRTAFLKFYVENTRSVNTAEFDSSKVETGSTWVNVSVDSLLNAIIKKNSPKVILIDVWGTWCQPCLAGIPENNELVAELDSSKFSLVYLCVQSQRNIWERLIAEKEMKGQHYLLSDDQYQSLREKYNINGIPHYILVDTKAGMSKTIKSTGAAKKNEILQMMSK